MSRLRRVIAEELGGLTPRRAALGIVNALLPRRAFGRVRALLYRRAGCQLGPGTILAGPIDGIETCPGHLRTGARCYLNSPLFVDTTAPVTLGDGVSLGHHAVIITIDHAVGTGQFRAGALSSRPVAIGDGAWIAAGATLLPGVTVGEGAVVAAGAVVTRDVPPHTLVGGIPARVIRTLTE